MWDSVIRLKDSHYQLVDLATDQSDKVFKKSPVTAAIIEIGTRAHSIKTLSTILIPFSRLTPVQTQ